MTDTLMDLSISGSLLGQLQRGQGAGFRRALRVDDHILHPLLLTCVIQDPRRDNQLEVRAAYYAELILHSHLPLTALDTALHDLTPTMPADPNNLILETLSELARRGHAESIRILHTYVSYGQHWTEALEALAKVQNYPLDLVEVQRVLSERCPDQATLDDTLGWLDGRIEPWCSLREVNSYVARFFQEEDRQGEERRRQQEHMRTLYTDLSVSELLQIADNYNFRVVASTLQARVRAPDVGLLLEMAATGRQEQKIVALRGLEYLADPVALPLLQGYLEPSDDEGIRVYRAAVDAIIALPPSVTLHLARTWFNRSGDAMQYVAVEMLKHHGTEVDILPMRKALMLSIEREGAEMSEAYLQRHILEFLKRFPHKGPYPEASVAFEEARQSWTRVYAAQVLEVSEFQRFSTGLAVDCLWDCEADTRLIGCESVDISIPTARERIEAIAIDVYEEERVRIAAVDRVRN